MYKHSIGTTVFRVILGLLLLKDFIIYFQNRDLLFSVEGLMPYNLYISSLEKNGLLFLNYPFSNSLFLTSFFLISIFCCLLFISGIRQIITGLILFVVCILIRERNIFILDGSDNVIWVLLPLLSFSFSHTFLFNKTEKLHKLQHFVWSLKSFCRVVRIWIPKAIMIQICIIYFFAGFSKLGGDVWINGEANYYILRIEDFKTSNINIYLTKSAFFVKTTTYLTLILEISFAFIIWFKKLRPFIIGFSILMHLGILILMRIDNYSFVMLATYSVFFTNSDYTRAIQFLRSFYNKKIKEVFLFK